MEFVWGRYSGLFYTGAGVIFFIGFGLLFGHFWFSLAAISLIFFQSHKLPIKFGARIATVFSETASSIRFASTQ